MNLEAIGVLVEKGGTALLAMAVLYELRAFRHELRAGIAALLGARPSRRRRRSATAAASAPRPVGD